MNFYNYDTIIDQIIEKIPSINYESIDKDSIIEELTTIQNQFIIKNIIEDLTLITDRDANIKNIIYELENTESVKTPNIIDGLMSI